MYSVRLRGKLYGEKSRGVYKAERRGDRQRVKKQRPNEVYGVMIDFVRVYS